MTAQPRTIAARRFLSCIAVIPRSGPMSRKDQRTEEKTSDDLKSMLLI
jgi:hypothetical protein